MCVCVYQRCIVLTFIFHPDSYNFEDKNGTFAIFELHGLMTGKRKFFFVGKSEKTKQKTIFFCSQTF